MASTQKGPSSHGGEKTSGLASGNRIYVPASEGDVKNKRGDRKKNRLDATGGRSNAKWRMLVMDLVLLLLLAGVIVGGVFGYRAIKDMYAPSWETRTVEYGVMIRVDKWVFYESDVHELWQGADIWDGNTLQGEKLGVVVNADPNYNPGDDDGWVKLTVRCEASYRKGEGYYVGNTRLLAGEEGAFRVQNITAQGVMLSLHEVETNADGLQPQG